MCTGVQVTVTVLRSGNLKVYVQRILAPDGGAFEPESSSGLIDTHPPAGSLSITTSDLSV